MFLLYSDLYMKLKAIKILMEVEHGFGGEEQELKYMYKYGNIYMKN